MKESTRIAVIGCGHWGKNLIRNIAEIGCLHAVCDHQVSQAESFANSYDCHALTFSEILNCNEVDAVMIASPAECHADMAAACLSAGKHVFVEKPLALDINEGKRLIELSSQYGKTLMVGHLLQYHPAYIEAKRMVKEGELGKLHYVYSNRLSLGKFRQEENSLWSFAPHDISMILGLIDMQITSVYATGSCHLHPHIEDITTTHLKFETGVEAHVHVSWLHPIKEQKLVIIGDKGMLVFDDSQPWESKLQLYSHQVNWVAGMPVPQKADGKNISLVPCEPLRCECEHFIECVVSGQIPRSNGEEGLRVLKVLQAAQRSMRQGDAIANESELKEYSFI